MFYLIVISILFIDNRCPPVPHVPNATPSSLNATDGSTIRYSCDNGHVYNSTDHVYIKCENSAWNILDARCEGNTCTIYFKWEDSVSTLCVLNSAMVKLGGVTHQ